MLYYRLKRDFPQTAERAKVVARLQGLRAQLDSEIPAKEADGRLLLGTWNIRDFGKIDRRGYGDRLADSHYYIAEILSRFDFVAVQEVNELPEWEKVMDILGRNWSYLATDVTDTRLGGNGERLTFLFDARKVRFQSVAGEIVLPANLLISKVEVANGGENEDKLVAGKQFRRTPFLASFQAGWLKFDICTVHLYYGEESGAKLQERIQEIGTVASYLSQRADDLKNRGRALFLLGDFNIVHPEHETMKALTANGFVVPKPLQRPTNINRQKYYDQIAFKTSPEIVEYVEKNAAQPANRNAGVFDIFKSLYQDEHFEDYRGAVAETGNGRGKSNEELRRYYRNDWRTYQASDHNPLWVRLATDDSSAYLERLKKD